MQCQIKELGAVDVYRTFSRTPNVIFDATLVNFLTRYWAEVD